MPDLDALIAASAADIPSAGAAARPADVARLVAAIAPFQAAAVAPDYGTGCLPSITCVAAPLAPGGRVSAFWPCDGRWGNVSAPCRAPPAS